MENNPIRFRDPTGHYSLDDFINEAQSLINDPVQHTLNQIEKNRNLAFECTDVGQIVMWAAPALAPLIIVAAIPIILVSPDSVLDLGFMAYDLYKGDYQAFYLDAMALMIPGVTGLGMLSKADEAYAGYRFINNGDGMIGISNLLKKKKPDLLLGYEEHLIKYRGKIPGYDIFDVDNWVTSGLVNKALGHSWQEQILEAIPASKHINFIVDDKLMTDLIFSRYLSVDEIKQTIYFKDAATHWEMDRIIQMGYEDKMTLWKSSTGKAFDRLTQEQWLRQWIKIRNDWIY